MNTFHTSTDFAIEHIKTFYQTAAIFEHSEAVISGATPVANDDPYEDYENLYLAPN